MLRKVTLKRNKKPLKRAKLTTKRSKPKKREKLPSAKTMRSKCDKLLTPIIKLMYPHCLLTGQPTEVAHHHVKKSKSNALRYYIPNLIPLTHHAHLKLHCDETYWSSKIVEIKGLEWWKDIEREKQKTVKTDVHFYIENYNRLSALKEELEK